MHPLCSDIFPIRSGDCGRRSFNIKAPPTTQPALAAAPVTLEGGEAARLYISNAAGCEHGRMRWDRNGSYSLPPPPPCLLAEAVSQGEGRAEERQRRGKENREVRTEVIEQR